MSQRFTGGARAGDGCLDAKAMCPMKPPRLGGSGRRGGPLESLGGGLPGRLAGGLAGRLGTG
jgi:hypothetical protein